ncbi:MAG: hypothetical protein JWO38_2216 [Gemmataceae bacterium]|nr:hypothetical protein [Gemmataceae bacterium]
MYETSYGTDQGLEPETLRRMREVFEGRVCHACGAPAARLTGEHFYCPDHFPRRAAGRPEHLRVYRCSIVSKG